MQQLVDWLNSQASLAFSGFDYIVFVINILILVFSRPIINGFHPSPEEKSVRLWTLRLISLVLFILYFIAVFFTETARQVSETGLTLLLAFLAVHFFHGFLVKRFGRVKEIEGVESRSETYQSEMFGLLALLLVSLGALINIINIWEMTSWLQATSVLGVLAVIAFSTKDVWAPDNINGLIILYNGNIEPGCILKCEEHNLLAITVQTTLTQTVFRDLAFRHQIVIPNARLRNAKIEILSSGPGGNLEQYVEFKIGYQIESKTVEEFLTQVWEQACKQEKSIDKDKQPRIRLINNGDHSVTWRLYYTVANLYRLLEAQFVINRSAYDVSLDSDIGLNTPLTHSIRMLGEQTPADSNS